jgi:hypothetical protein
VNVGTIGHIAQDTSGLLEMQARGSEDIGNPAPSTLLSLAAPPSSSLEMAAVVHGFDDEFVFDAMRGAATSIDFQVDVLPQLIVGAADLHVSLAIWQEEAFLAPAAGGAIPGGAAADTWLTISGSGLSPADFMPVAGGDRRPDFDRPFQFGISYSADYAATGLDVEIAIDNTFVEITTVPEPTSVVLVVTLGVSLVWQRIFGRGKRETKNKPA